MDIAAEYDRQSRHAQAARSYGPGPGPEDYRGNSGGPRGGGPVPVNIQKNKGMKTTKLEPIRPQAAQGNNAAQGGNHLYTVGSSGNNEQRGRARDLKGNEI